MFVDQVAVLFVDVIVMFAQLHTQGIDICLIAVVLIRNQLFVYVVNKYSYLIGSDEKASFLILILRLRPCRRSLWQTWACWLLAWRLVNILIGLLACWLAGLLGFTVWFLFC